MPGQAPSDENVSTVDGHVDALLATLEALDVTYVADIGTASPPSGGEIPLEIFLPLGDCLAWEAAGAFNLSGDAALKALAIEAEETLRRIARPPSARKLLRTDVMLRAGNRRFGSYNYITGR